MLPTLRRRSLYSRRISITIVLRNLKNRKEVILVESPRSNGQASIFEASEVLAS